METDATDKKSDKKEEKEEVSILTCLSNHDVNNLLTSTTLITTTAFNHQLFLLIYSLCIANLLHIR